LRKEVLKHIDGGGFMRQIRVHNNDCRTNKVHVKFGVPGGGLDIPSLIQIVIGQVVQAPVREDNLRLSFGNYPVKKADKDKSVIAFR
jgi:hypothetical protein